MNIPHLFSRVLLFTRHKLTLRRITVAAMLLAVLAMGGIYASALGNLLGIFGRFRDDDGFVQSQRAFKTINGQDTLNADNTFFQVSFGTNGQTCATCHLPEDGYTIHVPTIQAAFTASGGHDPLFRFNDTANDPNSPLDVSSNASDLEQAYSLALSLGVMRIGEVLPAAREFDVESQTTSTFGTLPLVGNDPQHPGATTLSLFRRPLVTSNMRFDSSVLWDGRADIRNIRGQVNGAATTLLLANAPVPTAELDDVANFMLRVFTDEVIDSRSSVPPSFAGQTNAAGAFGGATNLVHLAFRNKAPCLFDKVGALTTSVTPAVTYHPSQGPTVLTPSTCTPVVPGNANMTTFAAWANVPVGSTRGTSRRQIAHGEDVFNNAVLTIDVNDPDPELKQANIDLANELGSTTIHCTTCHATNNLGNHPQATFFARIGSDSAHILEVLANRNSALDNFVTRTQMLPQYCLRNTVTGPPISPTNPCGSVSGDIVTSDPGRAMVTGKWADIGKFKPPVLRNLAVRSPYFHGSAADSTVGIVEFYNTRFNIGLSQQDKDDLVRFVEAH